MTDKLVYDLYLASGAGNQKSQDSAAVSLGTDNAAMFEVWLKSASSTLTGGVRVTLQASNDGLNWTEKAYGGSFSLTTNTGIGAPNYRSVTTTSGVIPYSMIRLNVALISPTGTNQAALIDASIRTYRRS